MKKRKGLYKYAGYHAFRVAAELHAELFPGEKSIDGGTRKMGVILRAFDKVYTDGVEDAIQLDERELRGECRKIGATPFGVRERDV